MIPRVILSNIIFNEEYARKVIPHLKDEYFEDRKYKALFHIIKDYITKYNTTPSPQTLKIEVSGKEGIPEKLHMEMMEEIPEWQKDEVTTLDWLVDTTEKFCKERAVHNALMESISILDEEKSDNPTRSKGAIPQILADAISVSFDNSVGHDYFDDFESRYDFYHRKEEKVPFDLHYFNEITRGGVSNKSLNIILAGTGVGKSLAMCHMAAANLSMGKNVLYITLEMAEEKIAERIDANLLDVRIDELEHVDRNTYMNLVNRIRKKTVGNLVIKEYPTAGASAANFRALLNELKLKKNFSPDIVYIDYINICQSSRVKPGSNINSYTYIKAIAEELRGLAIEFGIPIMSATQTTRSGYASSDVELTDTSESFGLPATADMMFALISTEELQDQNQIMVKQLKNRYDDPTRLRRFIVGVDRAKMRLYDAEDSAQEIMDGPVFDESSFGQRQVVDSNKFEDLVF